MKSIKEIRAEQDAQEQIANEIQDSVSAEEWNAILGFNQYCANKLGLTLEFYRTESGKAAYQFRSRTSQETAEYHDGLIEDGVV